MSLISRLLVTVVLPAVVLGQTQIVLQQSKYAAPGAGAVSRSGAVKLAETISVKDYGAVGDGVTDDLPAINLAFAAVANKGQRIYFPAGTYMVSGTVIVPNKTQIFGVGRGDADFVNTVIKALPGFPKAGTVVQMGTSPGPNFGVQVQNLTIDGSGVAGVCLSNTYSEELSYGKDLLLTNCGVAGLSIVSGAAQNSGPFENLEIYPGGGSVVNASSVCILVTGAISFRGIQGVTCNAGTDYSVRPQIAMALDGDGYYSNIHIEHFGTGISLGNANGAADSITIVNAEFGPDVATGLQITAPGGINNQNISIFGLGCNGCTSLLNDAELGTNVTDTSLGWYTIGNGASSGKPMSSGNYGVGTQVIGPFHGLGTVSLGPGDTNQRATLNLWDARPNVGVTSAIEWGGAAQGNTDLFEWRDTNDGLLALIGSDGHIQTPQLISQTVRLGGSGTQPSCSASVRGTFWFTQSPSGTADHLQVCSKSASDTYSWVTVF